MKQKRYWLWGGIIILVIYGIITLILLPFGTGDGAWFPYWSYPTLIGGLPLATLVNWVSQGKDIMDEAFFILPLITYFAIGAVIGVIYGKVKNRRKIN